MPAQVSWADPLSPPMLAIYGAAGFVLILCLVGLGLALRRRRPTATAGPTLSGKGLPLPAPIDERRGSDRRWDLPIGILVSDTETKEEPVEGWILNRSPGGLCLSMEKPLVVGAIHTVRVATVPDGVPWVQIEIRYCTAFVNRFKVGCKFLDQPAKDVLALFG